MRRRTLLKGTAMAATSSLVALTGCSGGGISGKVVNNPFDNLKVKSHHLENTTILGTKAVNCIVTVENTGDQPISFSLNVTLYDGETVVASDERAVDARVQPGTTKEVSEAHEGRKSDVTRYEISITKQQGF